MLDATSMFGTATQCMAGCHSIPFNAFLDAVGARPCQRRDNPETPVLPALASQERHEFAWTHSRTATVEVIHSEGAPLQLRVSLPYPKRRWFSPRRKDWKRLASLAREHFGPGQKIDVAGKTGLHFRENDVLALISQFDVGRESFIELKIASGRFWC